MDPSYWRFIEGWSLGIKHNYQLVSLKEASLHHFPYLLADTSPLSILKSWGRKTLNLNLLPVGRGRILLWNGRGQSSITRTLEPQPKSGTLGSGGLTWHGGACCWRRQRATVSCRYLPRGLGSTGPWSRCSCNNAKKHWPGNEAKVLVRLSRQSVV